MTIMTIMIQINFLEWYDGYQKRKVHKISIKEELLPIAWHTSRYWDWCMSEDEKNKQKNRPFWPDTKFFDTKELKIKMSSVLNVSNGGSKPEEFSLKDIDVFEDSNEQNWFKRAHVGKFLGLEDIWTSLNGLEVL